MPIRAVMPPFAAPYTWWALSTAADVISYLLFVLFMRFDSLSVSVSVLFHCFLFYFCLLYFKFIFLASHYCLLISSIKVTATATGTWPGAILFWALLLPLPLKFWQRISVLALASVTNFNESCALYRFVNWRKIAIEVDDLSCGEFVIVKGLRLSFTT